MSYQALITSRNYTSSVSDDNKAQCRKPWCNVMMFALSLVTIVAFVIWAAAVNDKHDEYKEPISQLTKDVLMELVINDDGYASGIENDLITNLPNLEGTYDFLMFSGYLKATNNRLIHYWFVQAESDPESKPVILWTNGGPGCSGLVGLLTEHGPFWVHSDLTLRKNDYSWNNLANMLYVEQPYGVGFSQPEDGILAVSGDSEAAKDMDALLRSFMLRFPKFANNDLYISSESWGGHYMPMTALTILQNEAKGTLNVKLNFKGFLVGNPYTDGYENDMGFMGAVFGHGLTKSNINDEWMTNCWGNTDAMDSRYCVALYIIAYTEAYDLNVYALDFPNCPMDEPSGSNSNSNSNDNTNDNSEIKQTNYIETYKALFDDENEAQDHMPRLSQHYLTHHRARKKMEQLLSNYYSDKEISEKITQKNILQTYNKLKSDSFTDTGSPWIACSDYFMERYLNLDSVKEALHVDTSIGWSECSSPVWSNWPEADWNNGMETVYHSIIKDYDIKIMIFSGDDDSVCGLQGTMYWLTRMGWEQDSNHQWESWTIDDQLAGFYTRFLKPDGSTALHFQTVRTAGHMVPATQPKRALALLDKYLNEL